MEEQFTRLYDDELRFLRELGGEFATAYPKIASRLGMQGIEVEDPYVERLMEGFAFLTARVRHKMDAEFPEFTRQLLDVVMPTYSAQLPSMTIVEMQPDANDNVIPEGFEIPRGTSMFSLLGKGDQTRCEFRTAHNVTLYPVEVESAAYVGSAGGLDTLGARPEQRDKAGIRLRLHTTGGMRFDELSLDELTFYLYGAGSQPGKLYEQIFAHATGVAVCTTGARPKQLTRLQPRTLQQVGFEEGESLLPSAGLSLAAHRLLAEYFALPERFNFVRLTGLATALQQVEASELDVIITLDAADGDLVDVISGDNFRLFCTPAINLFEKRADRIKIGGERVDLHVLPDRTRPMDYEVFGLTEVKAFIDSLEQSVALRPLYETTETDRADDRTYYVAKRENRLFSTRQRTRGARSNYLGTETFLSLVNRNRGPVSGARQLEITARCTNRDLPLGINVGQGNTDFDLQSGAPVQAVRCLGRPTPPRSARAHGDGLWRLVNALSVNYLSLVGEDGDPSALRNLLRLLADTNDSSIREMIDGVVRIESKPVTHRLPSPGPICFGRGLEVVVTMDESAFQGTGAFMLGAVLDRFFARYVTLNTFTRTRIRSTRRGDLIVWPNRVGLRDTL